MIRFVTNTSGRMTIVTRRKNSIDKLTFTDGPVPVFTYSFDGADDALLTFSPPLVTELGVIGQAADLNRGPVDTAVLGMTKCSFYL